MRYAREPVLLQQRRVAPSVAVTAGGLYLGVRTCLICRGGRCLRIWTAHYVRRGVQAPSLACAMCYCVSRSYLSNSMMGCWSDVWATRMHM